MNRLKFYSLLFALIITGVIFCFVATAQKTYADSAKYLSVPGPANQDTSKYATFYIIRPDGDVLRNYWMGIYFDNAQMVRADNNMRYIIKYPKTGNVEIWTRNEKKESINIPVEEGKKYYLQVTFEVGGKTGFPKFIQLDEKEGEEAFNKINSLPLYVYDPDPYTNDNYIWPSSPKTGYIHMQFLPPLSTRHFSFNQLNGFMFSYYNKVVSASFSEIVGVYGGKANLRDKDEFDKFARKQMNNLQKSSTKSATIQKITEDSLTSGADYTYSVYFVETDSKPDVEVNGQRPVLELRQYSTLLYKRDALTGKGDYYSVYFSERGLPQELHSREEIRFKIQQLLNSCEFGDFKE